MVALLSLDNSRLRMYDGYIIKWDIPAAGVLMNLWFRLPLRTRLGIVASVFLAFAVVLLLLWYHNSTLFSYRSSWVLRFAPLLFLFWLALPELAKIRWWNWVIMFVIMLISAIKPFVWFVAIPVMVYILFGGQKK
jgi:hypothetical protein